MITKGKITEKKLNVITFETSEGIVRISLGKHGLLFFKADKLPIGGEMELSIGKSDVSQGYSGNAYCEQNKKYYDDLSYAKRQALEENNLNKMLEGL